MIREVRSEPRFGPGQGDFRIWDKGDPGELGLGWNVPRSLNTIDARLQCIYTNGAFRDSVVSIVRI